MINKIRSMIVRGIISAVNDSGGLQLVDGTLLSVEPKNGIERLQPYGFSSYPPSGCDGLFLCLSGNRDGAICIMADDRRHRPTGGSEGESCMYTDEGDHIKLKRGNVVEVKSEKIELGASEASEALALAKKTEAELSKIKDALGLHTHVIAVTAAPGVSNQTAVSIDHGYIPGTVDSEKVFTDK